MVATKRAKQDDAVRELLAAGCHLAKREDRWGETKSGWWCDGVYLGPKSDPEHCLRVLRGN